MFGNFALFIGGLAFLLVPLLLLLIVRRRQVVLNWAAYEWMLKALERKKKRVRITEILKLLSKLLLIFALALMLGRPRWTAGKTNRVLVIVDSTLSMATELGDGTRLDSALEVAKSLIEKGEGEVGVAVFDGELSTIAQIQADKASVIRQLALVQQQGTAATSRQFVKALGEYAGQEEADSIIFISDFPMPVL